MSLQTVYGAVPSGRASHVSEKVGSKPMNARAAFVASSKPQSPSFWEGRQMRIFGKTLLAAALAVFFGASSASAAFIVLNPVDQDAPGPATFEIILDGLDTALIQDNERRPGVHRRRPDLLAHVRSPARGDRAVEGLKGHRPAPASAGAGMLRSQVFEKQR